jgi:DNA invertase Pin-like site-specific DNA recombinase
MLVDYARVSTDLQTTDGQIDALHSAGANATREIRMEGDMGRLLYLQLTLRLGR